MALRVHLGFCVMVFYRSNSRGNILWIIIIGSNWWAKEIWNDIALPVMEYGSLLFKKKMFWKVCMMFFSRKLCNILDDSAMTAKLNKKKRNIPVPLSTRQLSKRIIHAPSSKTLDEHTTLLIIFISLYILVNRYNVYLYCFVRWVMSIFAW